MVNCQSTSTLPGLIRPRKELSEAQCRTQSLWRFGAHAEVLVLLSINDPGLEEVPITLSTAALVQLVF